MSEAVPYVDIDLAALARNFARVREAVQPSAAAAVVKADAYGLGVTPVARTLRAAGCDTFFVATPAEGVALREVVGPVDDARIFILDGLVGDVADFTRHALAPVLNSVAQIERWENRGPAAVHVDTGMNRLGLSRTDFQMLFAGGSPVRDCALLMTHLACADEPGHPMNRAQLELFADLRRYLPDVPTSIGNSAGSLWTADSRGDVVRAGIALYGGNPFIDRASPVEPVVSLHAPVIQVRRLERAETVGYGATFGADDGALIATVALGYADGYLRSLGNAGIAAVHGVRVPVVGRVSMDLLTIDVSNVKSAVAAGDDVELFGHVVSVDELAAAGGTISYELLTRLGPRVERRYLHEPPDGR